MSEHDEQAALFEWAAVRQGVYPELELMHAIPNGGKRDKAVAGKLRAEGVKAGVPDVCLPVPSGPYHGLYIEMKYGDNQPTPEQRRFIMALRGQGYQVVIANGWEIASGEILNYLTRKW